MNKNKIERIICAVLFIACQGCSSYIYHPSEKVKQVKKMGSINECTIPVYFAGNVPDSPYEVIGTCTGKSVLTGGQSTEKSMEQLQKCACKYGGDAVIYRTSELLKSRNSYSYGEVQNGAKASGVAIRFIK